MKPFILLPNIRLALLAPVLLTATVLTACAGEAPPRDTAGGTDTVAVGRVEQPRVTIDSAAGTTVPSGKDPMQGMDHSKMTGPPAATPPASATGTMPGMDHSKMGRSSAGADMAAMDHARMSGAARPKAPASATPAPGMADMPGMVHGAETRAPQNTPADDGSMLKLQRLLARLAADSIVRNRILADTFLRNRWQDSSVRRILLPRP